jgi:hypothetical protein
MSKTYTTKCGRFQISHITRPEDMGGSIDPFSPTWEVQSLLDGNQQFFETEEECKEWIKELTDE